MDLSVRAGEWDMGSTAEQLPHQERTIFRIIGHPDYSVKSSHIYDIVSTAKKYHVLWKFILFPISLWISYFSHGFIG